MILMNLLTKQRLTDLENKLKVARQVGGGKGWRKGIVKEFEMGMETLLYLKWITNKDLLYNTWNCA